MFGCEGWGINDSRCQLYLKVYRQQMSPVLQQDTNSVTVTPPYLKSLSADDIFSSKLEMWYDTVDIWPLWQLSRQKMTDGFEPEGDADTRRATENPRLK